MRFAHLILVLLGVLVIPSSGISQVPPQKLSTWMILDEVKGQVAADLVGEGVSRVSYDVSKIPSTDVGHRFLKHLLSLKWQSNLGGVRFVGIRLIDAQEDVIVYRYSSAKLAIELEAETLRPMTLELEFGEQRCLVVWQTPGAWRHVRGSCDGRPVFEIQEVRVSSPTSSP
jgi:hypothetical protein